jgi:hypothetical protein
MKEKIISKAKEMFWNSVSRASLWMIRRNVYFKKTIYKYFANKELLIEESVQVIHNEINNIIDTITSQDFNAIEENFEIRRMFENMFKSTDTSPVYQLKKHYPRCIKKDPKPSK